MRALIPLLLLSCTGAGGPAADSGAGDGPCTSTWWYRDADDDGWGLASDRVYGCDPGPGWAEPYPDCDDTDATVYPGAPETWYDGVDQDCDGGGNDDDADADGYSWDGAGGGDCDDTDAAINPGAVDVCASGVDENCDGVVAPCGFVDGMKVSDAAVHIERDPDLYPFGHFGEWLTTSKDSDGNGLPELVVQVNEGDTTKGADSDSYSFVFYLIEPPPQGAWEVESAAIARWVAASGTSWAWAPFRRATPAADLDGDGYVDHVFSVHISDMDDSPIDELYSRVYLSHGPATPQTTLDESLPYLGDPPDPWDIHVWNGEIAFLEPPVHGDDWVLAVSHWSSLQNGDVSTAAHLVTHANFEGEVDWQDSPTIWTTGGPEYDVFQMPEVGDLDGDGIADLTFTSMNVNNESIGIPRAWIVYGPDLADRSLNDADVVLDSETKYTGIALKLLPDWERTGDPVVAARLVTDFGTGWFFYELPDSGALRHVDAFASIEDTDDHGINGDLVYGGDLDADGEPELAVGMGPDGETRAVSLVSPPESGVLLASEHEYIIFQDDPVDTEPQYSTNLGESMLGNVDFNADGFPDLVVSEPYWDEDVSGSWPYGRISIFHGGPVGY